MHATDFRAYAYSGDIYCTDCLPSYAHTVGDAPHPIFASDEMDYYPVCCICRTKHDYVGLTDDGRREMWRASLPAGWRAETANGGRLAEHAWPGGYQLYYVTDGGLTICAECANDTDTSNAPVARDVHWEGSPIECDGCGRAIESAYGDPE